MQLVNDEAYLAAYGKLNAKQREAVDAIDGPVMVIAGPGTGKTQILTLRIANILRQTDEQPENILALTFTKSGARAMRERLRTFVGPVAYRVPIYTFHGLCERLIRDYPEAYTKILGGKAATEIEKIDCIERILEAPEVALLRPAGDPTFYVKPLRDVISHMKQENVLPDDLAQIVSEEESTLQDIEQFHTKGAHKGKERSEYTKAVARLEKLRALVYVYRLYEASMREAKRYDFDDMIVETVRVLRDQESVRLDLQETYHYILADEHQDVNGAQNEILRLLSAYHDNPNLFVVGDEKQAIYRFQGASLENFLHFQTLFPATKVIVLTDNYRSTQSILDAGHALVTVTKGPLVDYRIPLFAHTESVTTLTLTTYPHEAYEQESVVETVQKELASGTRAEEIAVIVRSNRDVELFAALLRARGIAVEPSADSDILEHPLLLAIVDLLDVVVAPGNEALLARVFQSSYWHISVADTMRVMTARSYHEPLAALLSNRVRLEELGLLDIDRISACMTTINTVRAESVSEAPHRLLARLLHLSGLFDQVATHNTLESTRVIRRLYDEVEGLVVSGEAITLSDVVALLRRRMAYGVPLNAPFLKDSNSAVQVMTAHKSKGLEFEVVIVPHVTDAAWGGSKRPDYFKVPLVRTGELALEANEDERRLLYVAMTRAKRTLLLSYAETNSEGKVLAPSPLLASLPASLVSAPAPFPDAVSAPFTAAAPALADSIRPFILRMLTERGLSATSLNNAIKNPWDFLYRNVIHLPDVQASSLQFGTAIHGVLEYCTKAKTKTGSVPSFSECKTRLEFELGKLPMSTVEFTNLLAKGLEVLAVYLPHLTASLPTTTKEELSLRVSLPIGLPELPELTLTGKLDRIDIDEHGEAIRVVDYKTGKPKTRNDIEGKTAKADASYRRQLSFYSLLLALHGDERYMTETGVLSFVEADAKGRIHEEEFQSGEAERERLIEEIRAVVQMLLSGDFLSDETVLAESEYAHLARQLVQHT
jgi:DNA helicase-2/ATP-dependent DNA helicase PcrA